MAKDKIKGLFMEDYLFVGSHEEKARKLTSEIDNQSGAKIFSSAVELFMAAAVVGCRYNKKSQREKGDKTLRIMQNQFTNHYRKLVFIFKLVMLADSNVKLQSIDKINNAFRYKENEENMKTFEEYMLGGVDIIYDKLFVSTNSSYDDYLASLNELVSDFYEGTSEEDDIDFSKEVDF